VRAHYEDLWERLPEDVAPPDLERRRALLLAHVRPGMRALDLGCGAGDLTAALAAAGARAVGVEIAQAAVDRARARHPGLDVRLAPLDGPLPLADASVELVWASEVIEHVADTAHWLSEVRRVLVPGGTLLLTTPDHGRLRRLRLALWGFERHFDPRGDHLRFFTRASLRELLEDLGFDVVELGALGGKPLARWTLVAQARRGRF